MDDNAVGAILEIENRIADICQEDNEHFSALRFRKACSAWSDGGGLVAALRNEAATA
jgi:hypothetical protein